MKFLSINLNLFVENEKFINIPKDNIAYLLIVNNIFPGLCW